MSSANQFLQMLLPMLSGNFGGKNNASVSSESNSAPPWAVMTQQFDFSTPSPITFKSHIGYIPKGNQNNTAQAQNNFYPYTPFPQNNFNPPPYTIPSSPPNNYNPSPYTIPMPYVESYEGSTSKNFADLMKQMIVMALFKVLLGKMTGKTTTQKTDKTIKETPKQKEIPKQEEPKIKAPVWGGKNGSVTGDPHFNDLTDSNKDDDYDFHGESGKIYNVLSDKTIQYNAEFRHWSGTNITVTNKAGIKLLSDGKTTYKVEFDCSKNSPVLNGKEMANGEKQSFEIDGKDASIEYNNGVLTINTHEYKLDLHKRGSGDRAYLDQYIETKDEGVLSDWVNPHGLLGQTADGDTNVRKGKTGDGAQGEGAIDYKYTDYEVDDLFDDPKDEINRFGMETVKTIEDGKVTRLKDEKGNLLATLDKDNNLVAVRHISNAEGDTELYLADGTTKIDETGRIID